MRTPRPGVSRWLNAAVVISVGIGAWTLVPLAPTARAGRVPPAAAIAAPGAIERQPFPSRGHPSRRSGESSGRSSGWWLGTAGIALALAACGAISMASKRFLPQNAPNALRVIGRTSLSPKHTVYLLQAGERVLIVGAGPQGAPSLLGELTSAGEPPRYDSEPSGGPASPAPVGVAPRPSFDRRVGDDE